MAVDQLTTDFGYRGAAAMAAGAGAVAVMGWLRTVPPRAPLVKWTIRILLAIALSSAVAGTIPTSHTTGGYYVLISAALSIAAMLVTTNVEQSFFLIGKTLAVGFVVGILPSAIKYMTHGSLLTGTAGITFAISFATMSITHLRGPSSTCWAASIAAGLSSVLVGETFWAVNPLAALGFVAFGLGVAAFGFTFHSSSEPPGIQRIADLLHADRAGGLKLEEQLDALGPILWLGLFVGPAMALAGLGLVLHGLPVGGSITICWGISAISGGLAAQKRKVWLLVLALLGSATAGVFAGVVDIQRGKTLLAALNFAQGMAALFAVLMSGEVTRHMRDTIRKATRDPQEELSDELGQA